MQNHDLTIWLYVAYGLVCLLAGMGFDIIMMLFLSANHAQSR